jgi:hypothetical protein
MDGTTIDSHYEEQRRERFFMSSTKVQKFMREMRRIKDANFFVTNLTTLDTQPSGFCIRE